jgi:putative oxygen-independent coproporphyrinogen III oxidase
MPGIYLHIPFCKQACHYCNFHFSTSLRAKPALVEALVRELELQCDFLQGAELTSIYFGGGTPSLLSLAELDRLLATIFRLHRVAPGAEITLEGNPDDLSREYLADLRRHTPVNRLSIGIQSFHDEDLRWMNRAHSAAHAYACLENARAEAFDDLTIDLIYGSPTTSDERWRHNLDLAFAMEIPHLSCYSLTVEPGTALGHFVKKGRVAPMDDEQAARQFEYLMDAATARGYEHYEISNFARPGRYARHNSSYWRGEAYLGIGPSAHSFDGLARRQWNVANNAAYVRALEAGVIPAESESLTAGQRYNEYVLTALRTVWGCETVRLEALGEPFRRHFEQRVGTFVDSGWVERREETYRLTRSGKLMADFITADLFFNEKEK